MRTGRSFPKMAVKKVERKCVSWDDSYTQLLAFWKKEGHCRPHYSTTLGKWCSHQRGKIKANFHVNKPHLSQEQIKKLATIDFQFCLHNEKSKKYLKWNDRYEELVDYKNEHGHANPLQREGELGRWCKNQRAIFQNKINKMIIREEKKLMPPKDPALVMPKRCKLPTLGTATTQLMESEASAMIDEDQFRKEANELQKQKEARGEGSIFSVMQPLYCPELNELINKRIDVLYSFVLGSGEKVLRWCQGKVIKVLPENAKPTVVVLWDQTQQVLAPRKWNKDVEGAWRMDINVEIVENTEEHEVMDLNDDGEGNGSKSKIDLSGEEEVVGVF